MTWQITLNHVCAVLYDISLLAQAHRCMQMLPQTLLFKSAAWHGTFDMIISHLSDLTSPSSDRRCQRRWEMMATLNMNLDKASGWKCYLTKDVHAARFTLMPSSVKVSPSPLIWWRREDAGNAVVLFMLSNSLVTEVSQSQSELLPRWLTNLPHVRSESS